MERENKQPISLYVVVFKNTAQAIAVAVQQGALTSKLAGLLPRYGQMCKVIMGL